MRPLLSSKLPWVNDPVLELWAKPLSEFNKKYSGGIDCFSIHAHPYIVVMKAFIKVPLDSVIHLLKLYTPYWSKQAFLGKNIVRQFYVMT